MWVSVYILLWDFPESYMRPVKLRHFNCKNGRKSFKIYNWQFWSESWEIFRLPPSSAANSILVSLFYYINPLAALFGDLIKSGSRTCLLLYTLCSGLIFLVHKINKVICNDLITNTNSKWNFKNSLSYLRFILKAVNQPQIFFKIPKKFMAALIKEKLPWNVFITNDTYRLKTNE